MLITPIALTNYDAGTFLGLKGFAAAMVGGIGDPRGAVVGGLVLGLLETFSAGYLSSEYKDAVAFVLYPCSVRISQPAFSDAPTSSGSDMRRL